ncbi:MAG TPA: MerR family transcriptional regulator [Polyangia bacterium]|nr:MerR family transcriptional regulator [Polyangia bacterium]
MTRRVPGRRSDRNPADASGIPDKAFFKIGEASRLVGVKPYVLRYWETEFRSLRPQKTKSQQRLYRRSDVELLLKIRHLLYDKRYTIEGARSRLRGEGRDEEAVPVPPAAPPEIAPETLRKIKQGLQDLIRICAE